MAASMAIYMAIITSFRMSAFGVDTVATVTEADGDMAGVPMVPELPLGSSSVSSSRASRL